MDRRRFVQFSVALASAALLHPQRGHGAVVGPEDERLRSLLDTFLNQELDDRPQLATYWGIDTGARAAARSRLNDYSAVERARWVSSNRARLALLRQIDRDRLSPNSQVDRDVVIWQFEQIAEGGARFAFGEGAAGTDYAPFCPYSFSQLNGPYQSVPDFLDSKHPIHTAEDAEAYLARLDSFDTALDASTEALRADAARRVLAADFILDTAIGQLASLRAPAPAASGLATSLSRRAAKAGIPGDWNARAAAIIESKIYPALDRQRAVAAELRTHASHDAGVWKLPDGAAYYAAALAFQTSTRRTPEEVHRFGLEQVAELSAALDKLLRAQGLDAGPVGARLDELSHRPEQLFPNDDAGRGSLLASLNAQLQAIRQRLPRAFRSLPPAPVDIVRVPVDIQDGAPLGYADWPSLDGSRPGRYYINLKDTGEWPKFGLPTLTYHEAVPGHQWQGAIALLSKDIPMLRQLTGQFTAYLEGWALYAEQLADELGAYDDYPLGRIGYLQAMQFRSARLVVDTGLHAKRWSREQATDYLIRVTGEARGRAQREIDRYCVWPGQACGYKIGYSEWQRMRDQARARAGARFDLAAFHEVLRRGPMPLLILEHVAQQMNVTA
jgi:uncharacterized protein (DUF885 family)